MDKNAWISNKIAKLVAEGRPQQQAVAIAYSMYERGDHMQEGGVSSQQQEYFKNLQSMLSNYVPALQPLPMSQQGGYPIEVPPTTDIPEVEPVEGIDYTLAPHRLWKDNQNSPEYSIFRKKATGLASLEQGEGYNSLPLAQEGLNQFDPIGGAVQEGLYGNQPKPNFQQYQVPAQINTQFSTAMPPQQGYQPKDYSQNLTQNLQQNNPIPNNFSQYANNVPGTIPEETKATNPLAAKSGSGYQTDANGERSAQYDDWVKYNIVNPYGNDMDLNTSLAYTGQQFGRGNKSMGAVGAGLSALKGARSFLSGYASGKGQKTVEQQMHEKLYNNDGGLYKRTDTYQSGGLIEDELGDYFPGIAQGQSQSVPAQEEFLGGASPTAFNGNMLDVDFYTKGEPTTPTATTAAVPTESKTENIDNSSARDIWFKKTGLPWSEAKRLGYTDGTAKDNTKLLGELNDPRFKSENIRKKPFVSPTQVKQQVKDGQVKEAIATGVTDKDAKAIQDYLDKSKKAFTADLPSILPDYLKSQIVKNSQAAVKKAAPAPVVSDNRYNWSEDRHKDDSKDTRTKWEKIRDSLNNQARPFGLQMAFQQGGYVAGKEYELDEEEIQNLVNQGYKIRNV